jgi:Protein of unknown function (DUF3467)
MVDGNGGAVHGSDGEQGEQRQVHLRIAEQDMKTAYANAFRTNATPEEVVLDFGLNLPAQTAKDAEPQMDFRLNQRVIVNYYSAKRLALALTRLIHRHEEQFGEIELDAGKRRSS